MNRPPAEVLADLVNDIGPAVCEDSHRLRNLLLKNFPDRPDEVEAALAARCAPTAADEPIRRPRMGAVLGTLAAAAACAGGLWLLGPTREVWLGATGAAATFGAWLGSGWRVRRRRAARVEALLVDAGSALGAIIGAGAGFVIFGFAGFVMTLVSSCLLPTPFNWIVAGFYGLGVIGGTFELGAFGAKAGAEITRLSVRDLDGPTSTAAGTAESWWRWLLRILLTKVELKSLAIPCSRPVALVGCAAIAYIGTMTVRGLWMEPPPYGWNLLLITGPTVAAVFWSLVRAVFDAEPHTGDRP